MAKFSFSEVFNLLKQTFGSFMKNNPFRLAAALAYNTIFSLPPLLIIIITAAGAFFGKAAVSGKLHDQIKNVVGSDAATEIQTMIANVNTDTSGTIATVIGVGALIFAATTFFITLQESLNTMWDLQVKPETGVMKLIRDRFLSFGLILSIAFLMLISFVLSALLTFFTDYLKTIIPAVAVVFIHVLNLALTFGMITVMFALIYKFLPDAIIRWKDVWVGSIITAVLFVLGKFLIALYLSKSDPGSAYGAAGSLIVLLVWIYYSSLILFFGSEVTQTYANIYGAKIHPKPNAVRVELKEVPFEETDENKTGRPPAEGRFRKA